MTAAFTHPLIIQGGMGVGISNWVLAKAVAMRGQMGVVSGTCIDTVLVRRLQDGDIGGHIRRAMEHFPLPETVEDVLNKYFRPEGREPGEPYREIPMYRQVVTKVREQLTMLASFVEVWLAKEGHDGPVGVNLLTKVQMPNLATLYGAMLASVDYVLMGAGIPKEIPGVLDRFAAHEPAQLRLDVEGMGKDEVALMHFDPRVHFAERPATVTRPFFLPIIASNSLATMLVRKSSGRIDGFIIEAPTAGGHNAPPRGELVLNERGEPQYGERDEVDLEKMKEHGLPFWLAGGAGSPEKLREALDAGAAGIQVGTLFAYADESGMAPELKADVIRQAQDDTIDVLTDGRASPTGFPFKVVQVPGTISQLPVYQQRERVCDLGYLRTAYKRADGRIDYRCPAEPVDTYVKKGGDAADTEGRKCLCNALFATLGMPQQRKSGAEEAPLITSGDELKNIRRFIGSDRAGYTASEVINYLMSGLRHIVARPSARDSVSVRSARVSAAN
ncbi:MAG TPA: nitronate monooxygenase [Longimicrobium sp.]|nr:nitronate monooxygenase [Longimicrobium sp.]